MIECDVLVVGCGPAGASAAKAAAERGAKTICIEKKTDVGIPVQCAEGIGGYLIPHLPFEIPNKFLEWRIDGIKFFFEGKTIVRKGGFWKGYTIDRTGFEKWLAEQAVKNGASIHTGTELVSLEAEDNLIRKIVVKKGDSETIILPKVVIAADGSESITLALLGAYKNTGRNLAEVHSWEIHGLKLDDPHLEQVYIGDFAPGGYGYVFPKSETTANIGVGASDNQKKIEEHYENFLEQPEVKKQVGNGLKMVEKTKKAVWGNLTDELINGNVIAAGDAANHNLKPFIEGILPAVVSGNLAGEIANAISRGTKVTSKDYVSQFSQRLSPHFKLSEVVREKCNDLFLLNHKKKHLLFAGLATQIFEAKEIDELKELEYEALEKKIRERHQF